MNLIEFIAITIGLLFVVYFSIKFFKSLKNREQSFFVKFWEWIKKVYDAITGIG